MSAGVPIESIVGAWREAVLDAAEQRRPLRIVGCGSKDFYGGLPSGAPLFTGEYRGIVAYEPSELFITARCGTPLAEIEAVLAEKGQMLAFEPPHFHGGATIGGCVAAGLSGPRRASAGAVRDFVLGARLLDGKGGLLAFGGQVMKNVAGYDVSRLLAGSMGILGLIAEVTLKVVPRPVAETTLALQVSQQDALALMNRWGGQPLPISASCWQDNLLTLRLSGAAAAVSAACRSIGGAEIADAAAHWRGLRDHRAAFFAAQGGDALWRLSLPSTTPALALPGTQLVEWGGALRWTWGDAAAKEIRGLAEAAGGHATLFRASEAARQAVGAFQPLPPALAALHRNLKRAFDPHGVFNPGRLYPDI